MSIRSHSYATLLQCQQTADSSDCASRQAGDKVVVL